MTKLVSDATGAPVAETGTQQADVRSSSPFTPSADGWQAVRLPELVSNGFPCKTCLCSRRPGLLVFTTAGLQPCWTDR